MNLLETAADGGVGSMQRRGHGSRRDAKRLGDGLVVEVGVVAQEEDETLALGKKRELAVLLAVPQFGIGGA